MSSYKLFNRQIVLLQISFMCPVQSPLIGDKDLYGEDHVLVVEEEDEEVGGAVPADYGFNFFSSFIS